MDKPMITVTEGAVVYLNELLEDNTNIRIGVENPGSPRAETVMSYCKQGEELPEEDYIQLDKDISTIGPFFNDLGILFLSSSSNN